MSWGSTRSQAERETSEGVCWRCQSQAPQSSSKLTFNRDALVTEFADSRHHPCHNTKTKLKSRGSGGRRHSPSDHNPFAKWKTLWAWEGREGRWTEGSTDDGPASEKDGTCVIMGDRRLSLSNLLYPFLPSWLWPLVLHKFYNGSMAYIHIRFRLGFGRLSLHCDSWPSDSKPQDMSFGLTLNVVLGCHAGRTRLVTLGVSCRSC